MTDEAVAIARLEAQMGYLLRDWESVKAVLLERSGDVVKMGQFQRDHVDLVDRVQTDERVIGELQRRLTTIENGRAREAGVVVGVFAVLQILWAIGKGMLAPLLGGGR